MLVANARFPVLNLRRCSRWKPLYAVDKKLCFTSPWRSRNFIVGQFTRCYSSDKDGCVKKKPCEPPGPSQCVVNPCTLEPGIHEPRVVIIGAGMAGLSAAHRLSQCGFQNFTVLEATERPGGRIHSCWLGDIVAELGASYIEGACVANPAFTLAAQECLLKTRIEQPDPSRGLFCTSDGRAINFPTSIAAYHTFRQIESQAAALSMLACERSHGNMLNFMGLRIQQELQNFPEEQRDDACRVMYGLVNALRCRCGQDLSLISANQFGSFLEIPGGKIKIPLGFIGILAPLLRELPNCPIQYSKPVSCINYSAIKESFPRAVVKCSDGAEFTADYVIVTVSLGVLKKSHHTMFSPGLPHDKVEAIEKLGFGHVNKIYLQYTKPFWVWKEGCLSLAWSPEELLDRKDWVKGIGRIEEVESSQHVLCFYVCGKEAEEMELLTDVEVAASLTDLLRKFTGDPTLPYPSSVLRSRWSSDHYFNGAYSYLGLDSTVDHQCELANPIPGTGASDAPVILFAGEATIPGHYSTVHGARISGIREAERIIQLTKRFKGPPKPTPKPEEEPEIINACPRQCP